MRAIEIHPAWRSRVASWVLLAMLATAFVLWTGLEDGGPGVNPLSLFDTPLKLLLNALPGLLLAVVMLALTRRAWLSFWLAWCFEALLYWINALKVATLATPLMPADFQMLGQLGDGGGHVLFAYLPQSAWPWLVAVAAIIVVVFLAKWEPPIITRRWPLRAACAVLASVALASLVLAVPVWSRAYDRGRLGLQPWSALRTSQSAGLISSLILYRLQYAGIEHHPDTDAATQLITRYADALRRQLALPTANALPDIVVVQSESFVDPGILQGYDTADFVPELTRLSQLGLSGRLYVPTFGGGTIRTEFEALTGLSLRYFPTVQFPYLQLHAETIPGLVRTLARHGYRSTAIHANRPEFWNRTAAFKELGFDHFVSLRDFPEDTPLDGRYVADAATTDEILQQLEDHGPPQFIFAISIEAHGPYDYNPNIDAAERDELRVPSPVTGQPRLELQNYLYHLRHADAELGRLAAALNQRERPTLLLFFGDHLPALVPAFQAAGFDNGGTFFEQTVPWLLIEPGNPQPPRRLNAAAWTLPGLLLDAAGIHDDAYFALTRIVAPQLAPLTRAPDAPPAIANGDAAVIDAAMDDVTWLRYRGDLAPLAQTVLN